MSSRESKQPIWQKFWGWLGHISRAIWLYHVIVGLGVGGLTFFEGVTAGFPLGFLIPLTVIAAGGTVYVINQFVVLFGQFREGYAYGLAYEGAVLGFNAEHPQGILQLGVLIRNVSNRPLKYYVSRFDVVVEDRTIANPIFDSNSGFIPRGASRRYSYPAFTKDQVGEYLDKNVKGSITFEFQYGHPDGPYVRKLKMKLFLSLRLTNDGKAGAADSILSESDERM